MEATTTLTGVEPHRRILAEQTRAQRVFTLQVTLSWLGLLTALVFLFSGIEVPLGDYRIKTIALDLEFIQTWAPLITSGVPITLAISALSVFFASILALLAALARLSRIAPLYALSTFYISLIRGTPLLVQIFFFFLALPQLGIVLPGPVAGVMALSLNYGAYMSEIFRAGIESVGKGQREAALALGMTQGQMMRRVVLPQALRVVIPPVGNEFIAMLKDSALVAVTGFVHETLWLAEKSGRREFRNLEALLIAALWYWSMTIVFTAIQSRVERQLARGDR
jgi:polar amino acid transport system permease protein